MRDAVEDPLNPAGTHVIRLHVGRRGVVARPLRRQRHDHRVLEDAARVGRVQRRRRLPVERDPQIHAAVVAEAGNQIAALRVDGGEVAACDEQQPAIRAIGTLPVVHPARAHRSLRLPAPDLLAARGVHSGQRAARRLQIHHFVYDERVEDDRAGDGKRPDHLELGHV